jgi:hypothetical protein
VVPGAPIDAEVGPETPVPVDVVPDAPPEAVMPVAEPARELPVREASALLELPLAPVVEPVLPVAEVDPVFDPEVPLAVADTPLLFAPELPEVVLVGLLLGVVVLPPVLALVPAAELFFCPLTPAPLVPAPPTVLAAEAPVLPCVPARYCASPGSPANEALLRFRPELMPGQFASSSIPDQL